MHAVACGVRPALRIDASLGMTKTTMHHHLSITALALSLALAVPAASAADPKPAKQKARPAAAAPAPAPVPDEPATDAQLEIASRVHTGAVACELQQSVDIAPIDGKPGYFKVAHGKQTWTMVPQETTTGAVRLEDRRAGAVWIQIPAKSMLMDARAGRRLVDACQHEAQRTAATTPSAETIGIVAAPAR